MIVIFDDMCKVCTGYIRFLARHDRHRRLAFVPAGCDRGREMLAACGETPGDPSTMIVMHRGVALLRSDAVLAGVAALGGAWHAIRVLRIVPRPLRDALYAGFARRRYRWFGRTATCAACADPAARRLLE